MNNTFLDSEVDELLLSKLGVVLLTSPTPKRSKTELLVFNSVGGGESSSLSIIGFTLIDVLDFGATFLVIILMQFCDTCEGTFFFVGFINDSSSSSLSLDLTFLVIIFFTLLVTIKKKNYNYSLIFSLLYVTHLFSFFGVLSFH